MFGVLFGAFGADWFSNFFGLRKHKYTFMGFDIGGSEENKIYFDKKVEPFLVDKMKVSEGYRLKAYAANSRERSRGQFTIGFGTSYLYLGNGQPFNNNYPKKGQNGVRSTDTLGVLKFKMGYGYMTEKQFAEQLIINHLNSVHGFSRVILSYLDKNGYFFNQDVKNALQEFSYGSGSLNRYFKAGGFSVFLDAMKTRDLRKIANAYVSTRYIYYKGLRSSWNGKDGLNLRYAWMSRCYIMAMAIRGVNVTHDDINRYTRYFKNNSVGLQRLEKLFSDNLVSVKLV